MPWHNFIEGESYNRDDIVAECEKRINSGAFENTPHAWRWLEHIRTRPYETLVWHPFGTTSYGRSPLNCRAWQAPTGEPICVVHPVVPRKG
jgi:hypothetical protein